MHGPFNGFRPAGASLPKPRSERVTAGVAPSTSAPFISDSIVVPEARDRVFEILERFQMPDQVRTTLDGSISGDLRLQLALFDAMVDTWPRLSKNLGEVQRAVRKAPWKVVPWAPRGEKATPAAEKLAKLVENSMWSMRPDPKTGLSGFEGTVESLGLAYYYGHGISEIHWERKAGAITPKGTMNVPARYFGYPFHTEGLDRLMFDPTGGKQGFMNLVDFPENRFLIGVNKAHRGHPTTAAPLRALTGYWLSCIFGLKWFMEYAQRFGQPIRWANYEAGDTKAKNEILKMMELIGSGGYGVFPDKTKLELVESSKSGSSLPQYELLKLADEQCDIFVLGQNLTSASGDKGARSLGEVHMEVRQQVIEGVCDFVGEILTHQLSPSIVALNFTGRTDTPGIWAAFEKPKDEKAMAERDNALGITSGDVPVGREWFYGRHSIPIPAEGEPLFKEKPDPVPTIDPKTGLPLPPDAKQDEEDPPIAPQKKDDPKAKEKMKVEAADAGIASPATTLEKLSGAVLEGLTGTRAEWLAPVRPFFDKLLADVADESATDEDFEEVLRKAQREIPELFGVLDTEALREAMEKAIGSAMLAGSVSRYEK